MLQLRLLGELSAEVDGEGVDLPTAWRARSLLAWLALHPGLHLRSDVAARFWPDVLDTSARASLRNALWALRRALGPHAEQALTATRDRVGLDPGPELWIDVAEAERLDRSGRPEEALALCDGELLADLDDDWVYDARDSHRERLSGILERLAARAEADDDMARAVELTRRRAELDRLAEEPQRALIRRLADAGDAASALAAYGRFRDRLREEIGISPSAATRELVDELREAHRAPAVDAPSVADAADGADPTEDGDGGGWRPGRDFPLPPRIGEDPSLPLVGRRAELAALIEQVAGGGDRMLLIAGEAGVGKSRLAAEVASQAARGGAIVLAGAAHEDEIGLQQPFAEALAHYASVAAADERERRLAPRAAALDPLLPVADAPAPPEPDATRSGGRRYAMLDAVSALLGELAEVAPVLVVLEDLQWADALTGALIQHVLDTRADARLTLLATLRAEELDPSTPIAGALARVEARGRLRRVTLEGLAEPETADLATAVTGREISRDQARALHAETNGNPLFVGELVRGIPDSAWDAADALGTADVPQGVRDAVARRVARLSAPCGRLLGVASVVGRRFELRLLEQVSDLDATQLGEALDEAALAGLVREADGESDELAFSHSLIRRALRDRLTRAHRRRIHARIADAIEALHGRRRDLARAAHHLLEAGAAGDPDRAVELADRAAESSIQRLAFAEAVDLYTRALALLADDDPRRRRLALRRALAYQALTHVLLTDASHPVAAPDAAAARSDPT